MHSNIFKAVEVRQIIQYVFTLVGQSKITSYIIWCLTNVVSPETTLPQSSDNPKIVFFLNLHQMEAVQQQVCKTCNPGSIHLIPIHEDFVWQSLCMKKENLAMFFFQEWKPVFSLKTQDGYNKIFVIDGIKYIKVILVLRM